MNKNGKHIIKGILSGIIPGLGQVFNKQYLKAFFFFIFFAGFLTIELSTSKYFSDVDPYDKLTSETDELFSDDFAKNFHQSYTFYKLEGEVDFPAYDTYYEEHKADGFSMRELLGFVADEILSVSEAKYFLLIPDLVADGEEYSTSNTGASNDTDLVIETDTDAIEAMDFTTIIKGVSIYENNNKEYYKVITGEGSNRIITYVNVTDKTDIITDVTGFIESKRTNNFYYDDNTNVVYIKSTIAESVTSSSDYRYTNILDSSDYIDATDSTQFAYLSSLAKLNIKGSLTFSKDKVIYVQYIPELANESVHGYNGTEFTDYFRNYVTRKMSGNTGYNSGNYNRMLVEVYFEIHNDLRVTFENDYYNFFYDTAGSFLKGVWSLITLGTTEKVVYNYKSLHDPLKSVPVEWEGVDYSAVGGILDSSPLQGHVSSYLLIQGLIYTLLLFYFVLMYIWGITDAYKTSKHPEEAKVLEEKVSYRVKKEKVLKPLDEYKDFVRIFIVLGRFFNRIFIAIGKVLKKFSNWFKKKFKSDLAWFKNIFTHGFEYFMMLPAVFVLTFITVMPILFGFLIAFTSYSGFDSDSGLFTWVGLSNFGRIFSFGEGIPFAETFWSVLIWTVIWAIASTATVFFGGMFLAVVISNDRVPFKKFWRTFLILPWAIPALISQMGFRVIFSDRGVMNSIFDTLGISDVFREWGILGQAFNDGMTAFQKLFYLGYDNIQWFTNANNIWFVRVVIIVINIWLGAPYFMALMTAIMTSIDRTLYEAADIDGASKGQKFRLITFPLVMYSTAPILVMTFSGNFNNFGVIYFMTGGGTGAGDIDTAFAGSTDILITWMYTLTVDKKVYNMASVFSILIFLLVGSVAAWNFSQTRAFKED